MSVSLSGINKTVQESKIYKKIKPFLFEEGLGTKAKQAALKAMEKDTAEKISIMAESGALNPAVEKAVTEAGTKYSNTKDGLDSLMAWEKMKATEQKSVREAARARVLGKNYTADKASNIDEYVDQYSGAVNAVKRNLNARKAFEATKGYYMNPINNGKYGVAATRIGLTAGAAIGTGAVINSLSNPYSSNY